MTVNVEENVKAITSWSGFVYQGMVALLATLNELNINYDYFCECSLEIEKLDDFSFKDNGGSCISIHQVKCKKVDTQGGYTDAISSLKVKAATLAVTPYLHTSVLVRNFTDPIVVRYEVDGKNFIPIRETELSQISLLKELVRNQFGDKKLNDSEFYLLNNKLNKHIVDLILEAHAENMADGVELDVVNREIQVQEFLDIIDSFNPGVELTIENLSSLMRQHFSVLLSDFIYEEGILNDEQAHMLAVAEKINELSDDNFFKFLQILKPDEVRESGLESKNVLSLIPKGFDVPFLFFVWKTFELGDFDGSKFRYEVCSDGKILIPTGMNDSGLRNPLPFAEKLYEAMFEVKNLGKLFYTGDIVVSSEVDIDNLFTYIKENTGKLNPYPGDGDNFTEPKKIKVLNIRSALDLLGIVYD